MKYDNIQKFKKLQPDYVEKLSMERLFLSWTEQGPVNKISIATASLADSAPVAVQLRTSSLHKRLVKRTINEKYVNSTDEQFKQNSTIIFKSCTGTGKTQPRPKQ